MWDHWRWDVRRQQLGVGWGIQHWQQKCHRGGFNKDSGADRCCYCHGQPQWQRGTYVDFGKVDGPEDTMFYCVPQKIFTGNGEDMMGETTAIRSVNVSRRGGELFGIDRDVMKWDEIRRHGRATKGSKKRDHKCEILVHALDCILGCVRWMMVTDAVEWVRWPNYNIIAQCVASSCKSLQVKSQRHVHVVYDHDVRTARVVSYDQVTTSRVILPPKS